MSNTTLEISGSSHEIVTLVVHANELAAIVEAIADVIVSPAADASVPDLMAGAQNVVARMDAVIEAAEQIAPFDRLPARLQVALAYMHAARQHAADRIKPC